MRIMILGGTGFVGRHLADALVIAGHDVVVASRTRPTRDDVSWLPCDFMLDNNSTAWETRLANFDVVINAVGILRESNKNDFLHLHTETPIAVFRACVRAGVLRVIQISALGAERESSYGYYRSKALADAELLSLPLQSLVLMPSLIYGDDGESSRWFRMLALSPIVPVFRGGNPVVQPVHIDDLTVLVVRLLGPGAPSGIQIPVVGPESLRVEALWARYRQSFGFSPAWKLPIPKRMGDSFSSLMSMLPWSPLSSETWGMLMEGNTAEMGCFRQLLGCKLKAPADFIRPEHSEGLLAQAAWSWFRPLALSALFIIWLAGGLASLRWSPREVSMALLDPFPVSMGTKSVLLWSGSLLDILLAAGLMSRKTRRRSLSAQLLLMSFYSVLTAIYLPEYWAHPFGPMVKNLAVAALGLALWLGERPMKTRRV